MTENFEIENAKEEIKEIIEKCIGCGMCRGICPVFRIIREETFSPRGRAVILKENEYDEIFYACSLCKACEVKCPLNLKLSEAFRKARKILALRGKETKANKNMLKNIEKTGSSVSKNSKQDEFFCC